MNMYDREASQRYTIGIIGFGKMGRIRAETIEADGRGRVVAVYDIAELTDTPYKQAGSAEAIINDPTIRSVFLCATNDLNKPLTIAALRAGMDGRPTARR
jgi:predicted dehydrogenase